MKDQLMNISSYTEMYLTRIRVIEANSSQIQMQLKKLRQVRKKGVVKEVNLTTTINPSRSIPGMTVAESVDLDSLNKYLHRLEEKYEEISHHMMAKYIPHVRKSDLDEEKIQVLQRRDIAEALNNELRFRHRKTQMVLSAFSTWIQSDMSISFQDFIIQISKTQRLLQDDQTLVEELLEEDPNKAKEAEVLLDYIERFNELFVNGDYESAAVFAVNSPRGILRNLGTMKKFKDVGKIKGKTLPLLLFFEALFTTSRAAKKSVDAYLTLEGIKCGLSEKRLDLVIHWVTQQSEWKGKPPFLSYCLIVLHFFSIGMKEAGLNLLQELDKNGKEATERLMTSDPFCSLEEWQELADVCIQNGFCKLSYNIISILRSQEGVSEIPPDGEFNIMEHVFW